MAAAVVLMSVVLGCHIVLDTGARQRDHRAAQARRRSCTFSRTAEREKQTMAALLRPPLPLPLSLGRSYSFFYDGSITALLRQAIYCNHRSKLFFCLCCNLYIDCVR